MRFFGGEEVFGSQKCMKLTFLPFFVKCVIFLNVIKSEGYVHEFSVLLVGLEL
jgi:hypothetical protein